MQKQAKRDRRQIRDLETKSMKQQAASLEPGIATGMDNWSASDMYNDGQFAAEVSLTPNTVDGDLGSIDVSQASSPSEIPVETYPSLVTADTKSPVKDYQVVGLDSEGIEIVYAGDAARTDLQTQQLSNRSASRNKQTKTVTKTPTKKLALEFWPQADIGVTSNIPTISHQLAMATKPKKTSSGEIAQHYRNALASLRKGNHSVAEGEFTQFIRLYPKHAYADNAMYWLAEVYYDQKNYQEALRYFDKVIRQYPKGNKVSDAMLKSGYCHRQLGQIAQAKQRLTALQTRSPKSRAAKLAAETLEQL